MKQSTKTGSGDIHADIRALASRMSKPNKVGPVLFLLLASACSGGGVEEIKVNQTGDSGIFDGGFNLSEIFGGAPSSSSDSKKDNQDSAISENAQKKSESGAASGDNGGSETSDSVSAVNEDSGTRLTGRIDGAVACVDGVGHSAINGSVTTTGSVDSVEILAYVDAAAGEIIGIINPRDFVHDGRNKTAPFAAGLLLANGDHAVSLCLNQSGSQGRTEKSVCTETWQIAVDCAPPPPPNADTSPPVTVLSLSAEANAAGWHNEAVTLNFNASDDDSGVAAIHVVISGPRAETATFSTAEGTLTLSPDGLHEVSYYAVDRAGNIEKPSHAIVKLDTTPPVISGSRAPLANTAGWNNSAVTASFGADDLLSGLATPGEGVIVLASEGEGQIARFTAADVAGNVASMVIDGINIDLTAPGFGGIPESCNLWPPNHKMIEVAQVTGEDSLSGAVDLAINAASSEDADGLGDGSTAEDFMIDYNRVWLRAERAGPNAGRTYNVFAWTVDAAGNEAETSFSCVVPHDQSGNGPVQKVEAASASDKPAANGKKK